MFVTDTFDNGSYKTLKIESEAVSMRIDAYNAVSQIYKTSSYSKNNKAVTNKKENDKYEISDTAKLYQVAKSAVASTSDVRMDMVNDVKARIQAGTYNISSEDVADKILDRISTLTFQRGYIRWQD